MKRALFILVGLLIGVVQICLRGLGPDNVIPNIALVLVVFLSARLDLSYLGTVALAAGVVLEISSAAPVGTQLLGLFLVVLVAKLLLRSSDEESRHWYLLILLIGSTIGYSLVQGLSISFAEVRAHWGVLISHIAVESLYNGILYGCCALLGARRKVSQKSYRLPR